jgi:hypothetical protein
MIITIPAIIKIIPGRRGKITPKIPIQKKKILDIIFRGRGRTCIFLYISDDWISSKRI